MKSFNHENRYDSLCIVFTIYMKSHFFYFWIKERSQWTLYDNEGGLIFNRTNNWKKNYQNLYINYFIYRKNYSPYTKVQLIAERCYIQEIDKRCTKFLLQNVMYKFLYIVCLLGPNAILVFYYSIESLTDSFSISLGSVFFRYWIVLLR